jgi:hypothetical protein
MGVYKQTKENALAFSNNTEINIECSPQQLKAMIAELQSIQVSISLLEQASSQRQNCLSFCIR